MSFHKEREGVDFESLLAVSDVTGFGWGCEEGSGG